MCSNSNESGNFQHIDPYDFIMVPLLKRLQIGINNFSRSNIVEYIKIWHPSQLLKSDVTFAYQCTNDNLSPTVQDGDIMLIHPQNYAAIGNIVLFRSPIEIAFGKVTKTNSSIGIKNKVLDWRPGKNQDLGIIGKVVSVRRTF